MLHTAAAWGIDLTGGALRAARVARRGSRYALLEAIEEPFAATGDDAPALRARVEDAVATLVTEFATRRRAQLGGPVFVALPGLFVEHGRLEVPGRDPARAQGLLDVELRQALRTDLEDFAIRRGPLDPIDGGGLACDYAAVRGSLLHPFVADVRRLGLPLDGLLPGPLALARYAALEWPGAGRRLVIELERTRTDFVYLDGAQVRWRALPFGCGALADGDVRPGRAAAFAARLGREHRAAHAALFGPRDGTQLERVVVVGDGARHDGLRHELGAVLAAEAIAPLGSAHFELAHGLAPARAFELGTALGLALMALDPTPSPFSFVAPPAGRRAARRLPVLTGSLLAVAAGLFTTRALVRHDHAALTEARVRVAHSGGRNEVAEWTRVSAQAQAAARALDTMEGAARAAAWQARLPASAFAALAAAGSEFRLVRLTFGPPRAPGRAAATATLVVRAARNAAQPAATLRAALERQPGIAVTDSSTVDAETSRDVTIQLADGGAGAGA